MMHVRRLDYRRWTARRLLLLLGHVTRDCRIINFTLTQVQSRPSHPRPLAMITSYSAFTAVICEYHMSQKAEHDRKTTDVSRFYVINFHDMHAVMSHFLITFVM